MTQRADLERVLARTGLAIRGHVAEDRGTVLLIGPDEPQFWGLFSHSPEYSDGLPDPLDRWSKRVLGAIAAQFKAEAVFPSDGPPYPPFLSWAVKSGRCWPSPIGPLVQAESGLFISFRGALVLEEPSIAAEPLPSPCETCVAPCSIACPVSALAADHDYTIPKCKAHLASEAGQECMTSGCLARRACPVAKDFLRLPEQSAFHMRAFMKNYVL